MKNYIIDFLLRVRAVRFSISIADSCVVLHMDEALEGSAVRMSSPANQYSTHNSYMALPQRCRNKVCDIYAKVGGIDGTMFFTKIS
jgi:hypothetical protein